MQNSNFNVQNLKKCFHIDQIQEVSKLLNPRDDFLNKSCKIYFFNKQNSLSVLAKSVNNTYLTTFLSINEIQLFKHVKKNYRKYEWFFGRLLAKIAIIESLKQLNLKIPRFDKIEIVSNSSGMPRFIVHDDVNEKKYLSNSIFFSIAHKFGNVVVASTLQNPVGIDIEKIRTFSHSFGNKFIRNLETDELSVFLKARNRVIDRNYIKTGIWCIKEATSKALGLGLKVDFQDMLIKCIDGKIFCIYDKNEERQMFIASLFEKNDYLTALIQKYN